MTDEEKETKTIEKALKNKDKVDDEGKFGRALTGCLLHDLFGGGGKGVYGYPYGRILNFVGASSSGKTLIAHEIGASEYHRYKGKLDYTPVDCEEGDSFDIQKVYNVKAKEIDKIPETVQEFDAWYTNWLMYKKETKPSICVLDSLDALTSNQMKERSDKRRKQYKKEEAVKDDGSFKMEKANFISSELLPIACNNVAKKKSLLIIISQTRAQTEMFNPAKYSVSGGEAMPFYCHTRILFRQTETIFRTKKDIESGRGSGYVMRLEGMKAKSARPKRKINIIGFFDWGVDDIATSLAYLYDLYTPKNKLKDNLAVEWEDVKYKTVWEARNAIAENPDWEEKLEDMTIAKWEKAESDAVKDSPRASSGKGKYG